MKRLKIKNETGRTLIAFYNDMMKRFGPQGWWPGRTRFEVITGAILTQNTAWSNVEKALRNLKKKRALTPETMHALPAPELASLIRPAGYFNIKAGRLKNFLSHLYAVHGGSLTKLLGRDAGALREELLSINGIGPETADSILLYAAGLPEFVVDAYTRRILSRHGLVPEDAGYEEIKSLFTGHLNPDAALFNEYHALIVMTGKEYCRRRKPVCGSCPLGAHLDGGR